MNEKETEAAPPVKKRYEWIDNARIVAALLIVYAHMPFYFDFPHVNNEAAMNLVKLTTYHGRVPGRSGGEPFAGSPSNGAAHGDVYGAVVRSAHDSALRSADRESPSPRVEMVGSIRAGLLSGVHDPHAVPADV